MNLLQSELSQKLIIKIPIKHRVSNRRQRFNKTRFERAFYRLLADHYIRVYDFSNLDAKDLIRKANPSQLHALGIRRAKDLSDELVTGHIRASHETHYGNFLHDVAGIVVDHTYGSLPNSISEVVSELKGIDEAFIRDDYLYILQLKSGKKWANSSSQAATLARLAHAKRVLESHNFRIRGVIPVIGCFYGNQSRNWCKHSASHQLDYLYLAGELLWELLSNRDSFFKYISNLITGADCPASYKDQNKAVLKSEITRLVKAEFSRDDDTEIVDYDKMNVFVSGCSEDIDCNFII